MYSYFMKVCQVHNKQRSRLLCPFTAVCDLQRSYPTRTHTHTHTHTHSHTRTHTLVPIDDYVQFAQIIFELPSHLHQRHIPHTYRQYSMGYRHMCRFFSGELFHHPDVRVFPTHHHLILTSDGGFGCSHMSPHNI